MTEEEREHLVAAGFALLMAAILLRDLDGAMGAKIRAGMPDDLRHRMQAPYYQDAFNGLPDDVQAEARRMVIADPDFQTARAIAHRAAQAGGAA